MHALAIVACLLSAPSALHTTVRGSVEASLTGLSSHEASALGAQIARLVRWRGDIVKNVHPGDALALLYDAGPDAMPELVALTYRGSEIELSAYRHTGSDGAARFYD